MTFGEYLDKVVTPQRLDGARGNGRQSGLLDGVWARLNVEPRYVVALWGIGERFRQVMQLFGDLALAQLAYERRPAPIFAAS